MSRLDRAVETICFAIATASDKPPERIGRDDDLIADLDLNPFELESLTLIVEEIFSIRIPEELWKSPLYRTPSSLAEWCIRQSDQAAWTESQHQCRRA